MFFLFSSFFNFLYQLGIVFNGGARRDLPNGDKVAGEGFVLSNEFSMFKLVDRPTFTHANMNQIGRAHV